MAGVDIGRVLSSDEIARIPSSEKDAIYAALVQKLEQCQADLQTCQVQNSKMQTWYNDGGFGGDPLRSYVRIAGDPPPSHDERVRERFRRREDFHRRRVQFHLAVVAGVVLSAPVALTVVTLTWRLLWWAVLS